MRPLIYSLALAVTFMGGLSSVQAQSRLRSPRLVDNNNMNIANPFPTCEGVAVTQRNIGSYIQYTYLMMTQLRGSFSRQDILLSNTYANAFETFSKLASGQRVAIVGGTDYCIPAYTCKDDHGDNKDIWGFNSCSTCKVIEVNPPTTPPTCVTSCLLCCNHFATPPSQTCVDSCGDRPRC